ncbi:MAG: TAXI family TRAP transporter solute-binding subunit [Roseiarcus sp.]|jgi:hypothetical protein
MSIRVQRLDSHRCAQGGFLRTLPGGSKGRASRGPLRATLKSFVIASALTLSAAAQAVGPQQPVVAQPAQEPREPPDPPAATEVPPPPAEHPSKHRRFGMVRYDKPVYRNGVRVLWHGAWREEPDGRGEAANPAPARPGAPAAGRELMVLADGADASATRMAGELASALQGAGLRAKPIAGKTSPAALDKAVSGDLADLAIAPMDALGDSAGGPALADGDWRARAPYVLRLASEPVVIIAPRAIGDIQQLSGRKVNVAAADGATAASAAIVFSRLAIAPTLTNEPLPDALAHLARGEIDAIFTVGALDSRAVAEFGRGGGFHVLVVPYAPPLRALYAPMRLTARDQGNLIDANEKVDTIGVPMALLAIDAAPDSPRAARIGPAAERLFAQFDQSLGALPGSRWRDVNLAARIFGWPRFGAAQAWLERATGGSDPALEAFRGAAETAVSASEAPVGADSDRLYDSLMKLSGPAQ